MSTTKNLDNVITTIEAISPALGGITSSIVYMNSTLASMGDNLTNTLVKVQTQTQSLVLSEYENSIKNINTFTGQLKDEFAQVDESLNNVPNTIKRIRKDYKQTIQDAKASPLGKLFEIKGVNGFFTSVENSMDSLYQSSKRGAKIGTKKGDKAPQGKQTESLKIEGKFTGYSTKMLKAYTPVSKSITTGLDLAIGSGKAWVETHAKVSNALGTSVQTAQKMKNAFKSMGGLAKKLNLGEEVAPIVTFATQSLDGFISGAQTFMGHYNSVTQGVSAGMQIFEGFRSAFGAIDSVIQSGAKVMPVLGNALGILKTAFMGVGTAIKSVTLALMSNPVVLVAVAIGAAAYLIYSNWEKVSAFLTTTWEKVKAVFSVSPLGFIINSWGEIETFFSDLMGNISTMFTTAWEGIVNSFSGVVDLILAPFTAMFDWLGEKFEWLSNPLSKIGNVLGSFFSSDEEEQSMGQAVSVQSKNTNTPLQQAKEESTKRMQHNMQPVQNNQNKAVKSETVINVTVNNPASNVDVIEAIKSYEQSQRNRQYEDIA
jgi:hypothetical protein